MVNFCQGQVQLTRYGTIGVSVGILMGSRRACSRVLLSTPIAGTVRTTKPAANWQRATRIRAEDLMVSWLSDNKMELCQALGDSFARVNCHACRTMCELDSANLHVCVLWKIASMHPRTIYVLLLVCILLPLVRARMHMHTRGVCILLYSSGIHTS